jgi:hypothetical protein
LMDCQRDSTGKVWRRKATEKSVVAGMGHIPIDSHGASHHTGCTLQWAEVDRDGSETDVMVT